MNSATIFDPNTICCGLLALAVIFSVPFMVGRSRSNGSQPAEYVDGYVIRYKGRQRIYSNGYPLVVDQATLHKALQTGDYELEGLHDRRILNEPKQYVDERLN